MADKKGKITRLGDPANPYTAGKVTRTGPHNRPPPQTAKAPGRAAPAPVAKPTITERAQGLLRKANEEYGGGARKRAIDNAVDKATNPKKR